jgi:hypothetical protein
MDHYINYLMANTYIAPFTLGQMNIIRDFIIFITVKSWCEKVHIIRIILELDFFHSRANFLFNGTIKFLTFLEFSWGLYFI